MLRKHCFECHDGKKQTASLRLDVRSKATKGGETGKPGIVPGKPEQSEIYRRLVSDDADLRMPAEAKKLAARDIEVVKKWIESGAPWPERLANEDAPSAHWAFVPPKRPAVPVVANADRPANPIDAFVLSTLRDKGLNPASEADAATLCRRLYLDLIGLPPSQEEAAAFVAEHRASGVRSEIENPALGRLVDRLLASKHYGERWGRLWLDGARYADSDGFEKDKPRFVWAYRDWVIDALNRDLPYDRFIVEQIAGDLLPNAGQSERVATGFLRNSMINEEGGVDPEQFRMEAMFDRMDAIGKSVLGLTVQCAQCHDHKYDPLTQRDYYRMFAFLNNAHEANIAVYSPAERDRREEVLRSIRAIEAELQKRHPDWEARISRWEARIAERATHGAKFKWNVLQATIPEETTGGSKYLPRPDGSFLALGYAPTKHRVQLIADVRDTEIASFRIELLNDPNLPRGGPGRSIEGTAALTEFEVEAAPLDQPTKFANLKFASASADVAIPEQVIKPYYSDKSNKRRVIGPVAFAIDGKDETAWGIDIDPGRRNLPRQAVFVLERPIRNLKGTRLRVYLKQNHGGWNSDDNQNHNLGRFRISISGNSRAQADPMPVNARRALAIAPAKRSQEQRAAIFSHWRTTVGEWKPVNDRIEALWKQYPEGATQLTLAERTAPRTTHILKRGDFLKPTEPVQPAVPAFLHSWPKGQQRDRLGFAKWLVDRQSPTTARSIVNRLWQTYFGVGLVASSEDLGTQSEPPSHPELLDWLAVELMEPTIDLGSSSVNNAAWSLKRIHKLIVLSATYRRMSAATPEQLAADPANRWLARAARLRLDAELVRDVALATSGLLDRKVGGPSVFPPLPGFLVQPPASYGPKVWNESQGPDRYRRALYTFRFRSVPYPALQNFDAPNGDFACVRRPRSNTPLQALTTMNEPLFVECAQGLAARMLRETRGSDRERIASGFGIVISRQPRAEETAAVEALLQSSRQHFAERLATAKELVGRPDRFDARTPPAEAAAWIAVARVLLNLDEALTRE